MRIVLVAITGMAIAAGLDVAEATATGQVLGSRILAFAAINVLVLGTAALVALGTK